MTSEGTGEPVMVLEHREAKWLAGRESCRARAGKERKDKSRKEPQ